MEGSHRACFGGSLLRLFFSFFAMKLVLLMSLSLLGCVGMSLGQTGPDNAAGGATPSPWVATANWPKGFDVVLVEADVGRDGSLSNPVLLAASSEAAARDGLGQATFMRAERGGGRQRFIWPLRSPGTPPPPTRLTRQRPSPPPTWPEGAPNEVHVPVAAQADAAGRVTEVRVGPCPFPAIALAAEEAVRRWRFQPSQRGPAPAGWVVDVLSFERR